MAMGMQVTSDLKAAIGRNTFGNSSTNNRLASPSPKSSTIDKDMMTRRLGGYDQIALYPTKLRATDPPIRALTQTGLGDACQL